MSINKKRFDYEGWRNTRIDEAEANRDAIKDAAADEIIDDIQKPAIDFYGSLEDEPWSQDFEFHPEGDGTDGGADEHVNGKDIFETPVGPSLQNRMRIEIENLCFVLRLTTRLIAEVRTAIGDRQSVPDEIPAMVLHLPWIGHRIAETMETFARWVNRDEIVELNTVLQSLQDLSHDIDTSVACAERMTAEPSPSLPETLLRVCTGYLKRYKDLRQRIEPLVPIHYDRFGV